MPNQIKPIKRSKQLTPLSHDHHDGLLFAWKIRQGTKNGTDINTIARYAHWFWKNHLEEHFREEEQILAPHLPRDNELVKQMFDEHTQIKSIFHGEYLANEKLLLALAQTIDDHIRFEERQLFPFAEKAIAEKDLSLIQEQLSKQVASTEKWEPEFWVRAK
jgi:hemerythrin-like domain-containing protein